MPEKVVIIGSGPAGWTAAIYAARANLEPLVIEGAISEENRQKGTLPGGQLTLTTDVENYPGFPEGLDGPEMMVKFKQQAERFGTHVTTDDVTEVDLSGPPHKLTLAGGNTVEAHAVIIATGARANWLGLENEQRLARSGGGVSACAVCDGALPIFRDKVLVVIGGGDSAMEEASYLAKFGSKVCIVHRRDALRASKIMQQRVLDNPKIEVVWNSVVLDVLGDDMITGVRLKNVKTDEESTLECAGYFAAIGHTPNTDFLAGKIDLDEKGYIVPAQPFRTHTNVEGVFAAGDVMDAYYRQAVTAAGTGCMSALDAERWLAAQGIE
jgi:thioredoxin reductase (NADPH)